MTIQVRGEASEGLAELMEGVTVAREREAELHSEQRQKATELDRLEAERIDLLQAHEAAVIDGDEKASPKGLAHLEGRIERLRAEVTRGMSAAIEARRRERERREAQAASYADENRDQLIAEVLPALLEAEEEVRGGLHAAAAAYGQAKTIAYQELDVLVRRLGGNVRVPDSTALDQQFGQLERLATTPTLFAPRELLTRKQEPELADAE
jgi:hypothetical protein